jgi:hypothetical protein
MHGRFNLAAIARDTVNKTNLIETTSKDYHLVCLILALDEAKLVSSIIKSSKTLENIKQNNPHSDQLIHLKREIKRFEKELAHVRSLASRK